MICKDCAHLPVCKIRSVLIAEEERVTDKICSECPGAFFEAEFEAEIKVTKCAHFLEREEE